MAICVRRGNYADFHPDKLNAGEWAVVLAQDPHCRDGKAVYICFSAGNTKRMATYEDMLENIESSVGQVIAEKIGAACDEAIQACETATTDANTARAETEAATSSANAAIQAANTAISDAEGAAQRAIAAAEACEGIIDNTRLTALESQMSAVISVLNKAIVAEGE